MCRCLSAGRRRGAALRPRRRRPLCHPRSAFAAAPRCPSRSRDHRAMTLTGKALKAGVMGWPIAHSRSPTLHGWWLARYSIDGAYVPMAVRPHDLATALRALPVLGFAGCNLTTPHKEPALAIVDRLDPTARRIGAVNTIVVDSAGALEGRNTDGYGFIASLRAAQPGWSARRGPAVL